MRLQVRGDSSRPPSAVPPVPAVELDVPMAFAVASRGTHGVVSGPDEPSYMIDVTTKTAVAGNPPGGGRWDDFAHHPRDGRLISVEGDNGDLLHIDPQEKPMKTVLKERVFAHAEASSSAGSQRSYSATFFDNDGNFYAVDSAGNVKAST